MTRRFNGFVPLPNLAVRPGPGSKDVTNVEVDNVRPANVRPG
jgi:hypothetical protein